MSTRATIHFETIQTREWDAVNRKAIDLATPKVVTDAIVYRHSDGYPEGLGQDLKAFILRVRTLKDTRLGDASYLAAKWVVFDTHRYREFDIAQVKADPSWADFLGDPNDPLNFLGCGIVMEDPGDIEYRYHVIADGTVAAVTWEEIPWGDRKPKRGTIRIPGPKKPKVTRGASDGRPDLMITA